MYKHGVSRIQTKFRFPRTHIFVDNLLEDSALFFSDNNKIRKLLKGSHYKFSKEAAVQVGSDLYSIHHSAKILLKQYVMRDGRCKSVKTTELTMARRFRLAKS